MRRMSLSMPNNVFPPCNSPVTRSLDPTGRGETRWALRWTRSERLRDHFYRPYRSQHRQLTE